MNLSFFKSESKLAFPRCEHRSPSGRQCSQPVCTTDPRFCGTHKPTPEQLTVAELTEAAGTLSSPDEIHRFLKAVLLNVFSLGAAYGLMVLVWQQGHGSHLIWGVPATQSIREFVPILVFAFLFGLSMDYEVFVLARMREEYDITQSTEHAIVNALSRTGRLVTSAAIILCISFASITLTPNVDIRVLAFGLAAGILLDATVIRSLLVPALVALFGRWNWWMPAPLERVLRLAPAPGPGYPAPDRRVITAPDM